MDKKTIENLYHTAKKLAKVKDFYDICRQKIGKTLWKTAYWGGVVALGLVASVGIMEAAGLDIVQPAYADAGFFTYLIGNLIYYYIIGPIGLLT
ncbi:MAG: hypothetical protein KKC68_04025, partial [Candidatus Thermoplasmatota archaeon]|nr:hypothetical protein [Candidatus Thermoplasmatota archaeon]